jgi:hypothetical protein
MYELVKQKKTGYYVILGIIIFAFISAVLKMALHEPATTINDDLIKAANQINAHAPIIIDSTTRLDRVNALSGKVFQYNFTIVSLDRDQIDTNELKASARASMISKLKSNSQASLFRDNKVELQALYVDKKGKDITSVSVFPNEY